MKAYILISSMAILVSCLSFAQSESEDVLNDLLGGQSKTKLEQNSNRRSEKIQSPVKLSDSFRRFIYSQSELRDNLPSSIRAWITDIVSDNETQAAHLWSAIQPEIPEDFRQTAESGHLYSLFKMNLGQTFFDQWLTHLADSDFAKSHSELLLEDVIAPHLDAWLLSHAILVTPQQETVLSKMNLKKSAFNTLKAYASLRNLETAEGFLTSLPNDNKLKYYLGETAVLARIKKNDLRGAVKILKTYLEPSIQATAGPNELALLYINMARILFQVGQLDAAADLYEKVPNSSPYFLKSREEMIWVHLRKGDQLKLRGELNSLTLPLFSGQFMPESYLVRAISDLKMCYYDSVEKDFAEFNKTQGPWAIKIDQALAQTDPPSPSIPDHFAKLATSAKESLKQELGHVSKLADESVSAALPAVGVQKHWIDYHNDLQARFELAKKTESDEFRREWKNQRSILGEVIRKMRFVKVEYLTQVERFGSSSSGEATKLVSVSSLTQDNQKLTFPVNGEYWPDELFKYRAVAQSQCISKKALK